MGFSKSENFLDIDPTITPGVPILELVIFLHLIGLKPKIQGLWIHFSVFLVLCNSDLLGEGLLFPGKRFLQQE
jgi:hypothetical protein